MATELVTLVWCDVHQERDEKVPGLPWTLVVVGPDDPGVRVARVVDLCEECAADAGLKAVRDLLDEHGRSLDGKPTRSKPRTPATSTTSTDGRLACPRCERTYSTRGHLATHAREKHDVTVADLLGEPGDHVCPECGATFGRAQGLGVHMARKHPGAR